MNGLLSSVCCCTVSHDVDGRLSDGMKEGLSRGVIWILFRFSGLGNIDAVLSSADLPLLPVICSSIVSDGSEGLSSKPSIPSLSCNVLVLLVNEKKGLLNQI